MSRNKVAVDKISAPLKHFSTPINSLEEDAKNSKKHGRKSIDAIASSLDQFGQQIPVVVRGTTIIKGNGTFRAAKKLGWTHLAAVQFDGNEKGARAFGIVDNRSAEFGEWDPVALQLTIETFEMGADSPPMFDFTPFDFGAIVPTMPTSGNEHIVEDPTPPLPKNPITKRGDLIVLGQHRLLCGDSTSEEDVERLMNGGSAAICFTSPPYNKGSGAAGSHVRRTAVGFSKYIGDNDLLDSDGYLNLIEDSARLAMKKSTLVCYNIQMLQRNKISLCGFLHRLQEHLVEIAIWHKGFGQPAMKANVLNSAFEFMFFFSNVDKPGRTIATGDFRGTISNVYQAGGNSGNEFSEVHAATFPLHLPLWILRNFNAASGAVYDPFSGTGTTLIAAQHQNVPCFAMDIEPAYCDVIVERWEKLTGEKAERPTTKKRKKSAPEKKHLRTGAQSFRLSLATERCGAEERSE